MPSTCTGIPGDLAGYDPATEGFLSASTDGAFALWHCSANTVSSSRGDNFALGVMTSAGIVTLTAAVGNENTNSAYQYADWVALNANQMFFSEIGGSANGNGISFYSGTATGTFQGLVATGTVTTQFSGATGAGYAGLRNLYVQNTVGGPVLYVTYAGQSSAAPASAASPGVTFQGINQFNLTATWLATPRVNIDPWNLAQYVPLTPTLTEPRGFVPSQPVAPFTIPATIWATELSTGLYRYSLNQTSGALLVTSGPFVPTTPDSMFGGVALSADGSTAYLTAAAGVCE